MPRPSLLFRHAASNSAPRTWKGRLLNAFALVALPASAAFAAEEPRPLPPAIDGTGVATLRPVEDEGSVRLRSADEAAATAGLAGPMIPGTPLPSDPEGAVIIGDGVPPAPADLGFTDNLGTVDGGAAVDVRPPSYYEPMATPTAQAMSADGLGYEVSQDPTLVLYQLRRNNLDIAGVNEGFTSLSALVPFAEQGPDAQFFINPRFIFTDRGHSAANVGLGKRWYDAGLNRAYELSGWYDWDAGHVDEYHQFGFHAAMIGRGLEFRTGANIPVSDDGRRIGDPTVNGVGVNGSNVLVDLTQITEFAFQQYYAEVATPLGTLGGYGMTLGLGGYFLNNDDAPTQGLGVAARVEAQVNEDLWANVIVSSDPVSDFNVSLNFELTFPDGMSGAWFRKPCPRDYLRSTTRRNYRVFAEQLAVRGDVAPLDKSGNPYTVAFIDPTAVDGGTGTQGNPFGSTADFMAVAAAERGEFDVIVVSAGDNPLNPSEDLDAPITLLDCQQLVGDTAEACLFTDSIAGLDRITLPAFNPIVFDAAATPIEVNIPTVSNAADTSQPVITIADGARNVGVSGLRIDANGNDAIVGENVSGFTITQNEFTRFRTAVDLTNRGDSRGVFSGNIVRGSAGSPEATLQDLGFTLADLGLTIEDFAGLTVTRFPTEAEVLSTIGFDPTTAQAILLDEMGEPVLTATGEPTMLTRTDDAGNTVPVTLPLGTDTLGLTLADLGLSLDDFAVLQDFPVLSEADVLGRADDGTALFELVGIDAGTDLGDGFGRIGGFILDHEGGNLDLLVSNNSVFGITGEDANQDGLLTPGEVTDVNGNGRLDPAEDVNGNGVLDFGRAISITASSGVINANTPSTADGVQDFKLNTGIIDNKVGQFGADGTGLAGSGATFGIEVIAEADGKVNLVETGNMVTGGIGAIPTVVDPGFLVLADGGMIMVDDFSNNMASGAFEDGGRFIAQNGGMLQFVRPASPDAALLGLDPAPAFTNNSFMDNGRDGAVFIADDGTILLDGLVANDFSGNVGDGLSLQTANGGNLTIQDPINGNTYSGNTGAGIAVDAGDGVINANFLAAVLADATGDADAGVTVNPELLADNGQGLRVDVGPAGVFTTSINGLNVSGGSGDGLVFAIDGGVLNLTDFTNVTADGNAGSGVVIDVINGGTFNTPSITNSTFNNNGRAGLRLSSDGSDAGESTINLGSVTNNQFNRQAIPGDVGLVDVDGNPVDINGNPVEAGQLSVAASSGFGIELDVSDTVVNGVIAGNEFIGSTVGGGLGGDPDPNLGVGPGIGGVVENGGLNLEIGSAANAEGSNLFAGNGVANIGVIFAGDSVNDVRVRNNVIRDAFGDGSSVSLTGPLKSLATTNAAGQFGGDGINFDVRDEAILTGDILGNKIFSNAADGIDISVSGGSELNAGQVTDFQIAGNIITGNGDNDPPVAGAGDNVLLGQQDLGDNGVQIVQTASGQLNNVSVESNVISLNTNNGVLVDATSNGLVGPVQIANNSIRNNGFLTVEPVNGDQIQLDPNSAAAQSDLVELVAEPLAPGLPATYEFVGLDGPVAFAVAQLVATDGTILGGTTLDILGNEPLDRLTPLSPGDPLANRSTGSGVVLTGRGDADLEANVVDNDISANAESGILIQGQTSTPADEGSVGGNILRNTIMMNVQDGIAINGVVENLSIGLTGDDTSGNRITDNGSDGIEITEGGDVIIANNVIGWNGLGATIDPVTGVLTDFDEGGAFNNPAGIDITLGQSSNLDIFPSGGLVASIVSNDITENRGDGIEWTNINQTRGASVLNIAQNTIDRNAGRGLDILLHSDSDNTLLGGVSSLDVELDNNVIASNGLQGILVVGTNDAQQDQTGRINDDFFANDGDGREGAQGNDNAAGNVEDAYFLTFDARGNEISSNGSDIQESSGIFPDADNTGGVVFRVGTTGGDYGLTVDGGYATDDAGNLINPGMAVTLLNNAIAGNFGDDLYIESFTSTVDPDATAGQWETDLNPADQEFSVDNYSGDPLARLDLTYFNNAINSSNVVNVGAYYDNDEGDFKSRTFDPDGDDFVTQNNGPFESATRERNAQRLADRQYPDGSRLNPPVQISLDDEVINTQGFAGLFNSGINGGEDFLFPGMGDSTFRLNLTVPGATPDEVLAELNADGFFGFAFDDNPTADPSPIENIFEQGGIFREDDDLGVFGQRPYGYGTYFLGNGLPN